MTHVLIVGADIGGTALATLLSRAAHQVTVVEQAPALRLGGQTVDLRGAAQIAQPDGLTLPDYPFRASSH